MDMERNEIVFIKMKKLLSSFLITGSTKCMGLLTATSLTKFTPTETDDDKKRIIGVQGRDPKKIQTAIQ